MNDELKLELEALTTDDLEGIVGTHLMFQFGTPLELRSIVRRRQTVASEILASRAGPSPEA